MTKIIYKSAALPKKISLIVLIIGYLLAGVNHFVHPAGYMPIIPVYLPFPKLMNLLAGGFELLFALMLIFPKARPIAAWGIILMLAAFMAVHIQMILDAPFKLGNLMITPLLAWARVLLQPLLMLWAGWHVKRVSPPQDGGDSLCNSREGLYDIHHDETPPYTLPMGGNRTSPLF